MSTTRSYPVLYDMPQRPKPPLKPVMNTWPSRGEVEFDSEWLAFTVADFKEVAADHNVPVESITLDLEHRRFTFEREQTEEEKLIAQQEYETELIQYEKDLIVYQKEEASYNEKLRNYYLAKAASIK